MAVLSFLKAIIAGFIVAVPVGAIGALCLRRALLGRWGDALITGFGAALADALLAATAMLGLSLITQYLLDHEGPVRLVGGIFLIVIGWRMIRRRARPGISDSSGPPPVLADSWREWLAHAATGFGLTIINPATLVAFIGVFAGLGLFAGNLQSLASKWFVVVGAFVGSMLWWMTLIFTAAAMRRHIPTKAIALINLLFGVIVIGLGGWSIASFLQMQA